MPEVRLIDANALIKDIAESIRLADDWEKEAYEIKDEIGMKYAVDTRRSLMAMISRIKEAPTIKAEPVRRGRWILYGRDTEYTKYYRCSLCGYAIAGYAENDDLIKDKYCPNCGARMDARDTNVPTKNGGADNG